MTKGQKRKRTCQRKVRYNSKWEAAAVWDAMMYQGRAASTLEIYRCGACKGWHLGNKPANAGPRGALAASTPPAGEARRGDPTRDGGAGEDAQRGEGEQEVRQ